MSVRRRTWTNRDGSESESWVVNYTDQRGKRRLKTFERRKDADAYEATVNVDVRKGLHIPDSDSITIAAAGKLWLETGDLNGLERTTLDGYRQHLDFHIEPLIGAIKLSQFSVPGVRAFKDQLRRDRSPAMVKKVMGSLSAILTDAQERGLVSQNVVRALSQRGRRSGKERQAEKRQRGKLQVGVDIPTPEEINVITGALNGRWRPLLLTAILTGLRASELRGLRWIDVDLKRGELHVRQRADRYNKIDAPKTAAGHRTVELPPKLVNVLREWKLVCPKGELGLAFPNGIGRIESHANIVNRGLVPVQVAAGVVTANGKAKYTGLHMLRHFFASWCINRKANGGLELGQKEVQELLGHESIQLTLDRYGHLFPRRDNGKDLAAAEAALLQ